MEKILEVLPIGGCYLPSLVNIPTKQYSQTTKHKNTHYAK
jgi:hypothetical protein